MTAINQLVKKSQEMDLFTEQLKEWIKEDRPKKPKN